MSESNSAQINALLAQSINTIQQQVQTNSNILSATQNVVDSNTTAITVNSSSINISASQITNLQEQITTNTNDIENLTGDELNYYGYLIELNKVDLCNILQNFFKKNNLLSTQPKGSKSSNICSVLHHYIECLSFWF